MDTDGTPDVNVLYENRPIDTTGPSGRVLLPDLRSFEVNRVSVNPNGLPLDVDAGSGMRVVRPADRSGVVVHFDMRRRQSALLQMMDEGGHLLPIGSTLRLAPEGALVVVGHGG